MNLKLSALAGILLLAVLLSGCTSQTATNSGLNTETAKAAIKIIDANGNEIFGKTIDFAKGSNGLNVLENSGLQVEAKTYVGMGSMVTGINGITADSAHYWALYVNGAYADKAIDAYILNSDTAIELRLEKIDFSKLS